MGRKRWEKNSNFWVNDLQMFRILYFLDIFQVVYSPSFNDLIINYATAYHKLRHCIIQAVFGLVPIIKMTKYPKTDI